MPIRLTILGSGSAGNCAYPETDETRVLMDAEFSRRQIRQRFATIGRAPENLTGILVTHEHSPAQRPVRAGAQKANVLSVKGNPT